MFRWIRNRRGMALSGLASGAVLCMCMVYLLVGDQEWGRLLASFAPSLIAAYWIVIVFFKRREQEYYQCHDTFTEMGNWNAMQRDFSRCVKQAGSAWVLIRVNELRQLRAGFDRDGDEAIRSLCPPLKRLAKELGAAAYRILPNRFVLWVPQADRQPLVDALARTLPKIENDSFQEIHCCYYTFSYGVYFLSSADQAIHSVRALAAVVDKAIAQLDSVETRTGYIFEEKDKPNWELMASLNEDLDQAWENREFVPYYQLVYDLESGRAEGAELLTRWQHPEKGLLLPEEFLLLMESRGLMTDLDLYMLEEACKKIKGWFDAELLTVPISINISIMDLFKVGFVDKVFAIVKAYDVPPILIELELAGALSLIAKNGRLLQLMHQLHECGFVLALDNFSLAEFPLLGMLRDLPIDAVKLNCQSLEGFEESERDRAWVENMIRWTKELGIHVVAMGVETNEQVRLLCRLGCDQAQGFYYSKPMSNEEAEKQIF